MVFRSGPMGCHPVIRAGSVNIVGAHEGVRPQPEDQT